jgi:hypothetical protein
MENFCGPSGSTRPSRSSTATVGGRHAADGAGGPAGPKYRGGSARVEQHAARLDALARRSDAGHLEIHTPLKPVFPGGPAADVHLLAPAGRGGGRQFLRCT